MWKSVLYGDNLELSLHVRKLIKALKKVDKQYLGYETLKHHTSDTMVKHAERVFAYELYHQFRISMKKECGYYLSGEILKDTQLFYWELNRDCYPDLVLHSNMGNPNNSKQYFLCEIKMSDNKELLNDLAKLAYLSDSSLKFDDYIFLCIGYTKEMLEKKIKDSQKKRYFKKDTLCICRMNKTIEVFRLKEIL